MRALRVGVHVAHAGRTGYEPLHGVVRARHPREQPGHRQADGDQHAAQDVEDQRPGKTSSWRCPDLCGARWNASAPPVS